MSAPIQYTVSMTKPHTHLLDVEMRITGWPGSSLDLVMPSWTPGSYLMREYPRHVQEFSVCDESGQSLPCTKTSKGRWRIETNKAETLIVRYKVYAYELTVRTNYLDGDRAYFNGAATFMYPDSWRERPALLTVRPAPGWTVATSLPRVDENLYEVDNFDTLVDSPILCGKLARASFQVEGIPHEIAIDGEGNYNLEAVRTDLQRIVEAAGAIFKGLPYDRYVFLVLLTDKGSGGLEHRFSNTCIVPSLTFRPRKSYERFLSLEAHEHLHAWNGKRLRPAAFRSFDYTQEQYTRLLWFIEGVTDYYTGQVLRRAQLISTERSLERLADNIKRLQTTPGRFLQSLEDASFDAWIKYYRRDENTDNSSVSYYLKGNLVGLVLDLTIRGQTGGQKSLDDVMRALWHDPDILAHGIPETGLQEIAEAVTGVPLGEVFDNYVRGVEEIPWNRYLGYAGLRLEVTPDGDDRQEPRAYLGIHLRDDGEAAVIERVPSGSPAYEAGVYAGDEIIAINGYKVTRSGLEDRLKCYRPGDTVLLHLFRQGVLREVPITLAMRPRERYRIQPLTGASEAQKAVRRGWLHEEGS